MSTPAITQVGLVPACARMPREDYGMRKWRKFLSRAVSLKQARKVALRGAFWKEIKACLNNSVIDSNVKKYLRMRRSIMTLKKKSLKKRLRRSINLKVI